MRQLLLVFIFVVTGCCETYETLYLDLCQNQPTGLVAENIGDQYQKSQFVWHYTFNLPGSSSQNCDVKFLETKQFIEVPQVEVVRFSEHNVGNAYYIVDKITPINLDSSKYVLRQGRETFIGVYNNDGVCDGGNAPSLDNFYIRFNNCSGYAILGDTFGLKRID